MYEMELCPYCGGKATVHPFVYRVVELPKPIPLFGRWSLIKMRYKEIPCSYTAECADFCDGFCDGDLFAVGETPESAVETWNNQVKNRK